MLNLPDVTLVCIEQLRPAKALDLMAEMVRLANFGNVLWASNFFGYEEMIRTENTIHEQVRTSHLLTVHLDGFILNPDLWNSAWLQYDYIGAPWPASRYAHRVGNSGFCLRSVRLSRRVQELPVIQTNYDLLVSQEHRTQLEHEGFKFAPLEEAARFSEELPIPETPERTFGFHGKWPERIKAPPPPYYFNNREATGT